MAWNRILEFNALVKLHIYKYIYKYTYKKWIKYESEKIREKYIYINIIINHTLGVYHSF